MAYSWLVLIPPFLVLILSFIFKNVVPSLIVGIISGAFIASFLSGKSPFAITISSLSAQMEFDTMCIFLFLIILGTLIALMNTTGGIHAYAYALQKRLKNKKSTETASIALSFCFLIDDFFSALTVGSIMRPLTDKFRIPRAKLAFLLDAMAAPLVVLVPISSWIATLTSQFEKSGISLQPHENPIILADPFSAYLHVIPFIFYSFISIFATIFIVRQNISFGPMAYQEQEAEISGNLFGGKKAIQTQIELIEPRKGSLFDFMVPLFSLIICVFGFLLYLGDFVWFGGNSGFTQAMLQSNIFLALFLGSLFALCLSFIYTLYKHEITIKDFIPLFKTGFDIMGSAIVILFFAWTFSTLLRNDLHTGSYIAQILSGILSPILLPAGFFVITTITSIATGSSWGTIAVMLPLAIPMLTSFVHLPLPTSPENVPLLFPLLGAVLAGAIAGDQISPIASTTIMSSSSSGCYHKDHVYTQFIYALPSLIASFIAFIIAGYMVHLKMSFWSTASISIACGISICTLLLFMCQYLFGIDKK